MVNVIRFIILGDSKGKEYGINKKVLLKIMKESYKLEPDFIVMLGDNITGSKNETILTSQYLNLRRLIEDFYPTKLLLPVVGNHEVNIEPIDDRYEKIFSRVFNDFCPTEFLGGYHRTVYYKDFQDTRIIVLNSFHYGAIHQIDSRQLGWFKNVAAANIKNKLVFVHSPAYPTGAHLGHCLDLYPELRDAFWNVVDKCNIDVVFSGHEHNYSRRLIDSSFNNSFSRSVYQIISGGAGEKLKDKFTDRRGVIVKPKAVYHFLSVDIKEDYIKISAIRHDGNIIDEFTIDKT